jgi:hypothetical protein
MKKQVGILVLGAWAVTVWAIWPVEAQQAPAGGPSFTADGQLIRPADYREWTFVTSGLGMTYGPAAAANAGRPPMFDNVFVNREAYRAFTQSGEWPDKTIFILEIRRGEENVSINNGGRTQGEPVAVEAAVKDVKRFASTGGWGYFDLGAGAGAKAAAAALPETASCYNCHKNNTAVENTFVQFYPTLFEVAKNKGTVKPTYDPGKKAGSGQ